jgi:periplasmic copper chaperone A
MSFARSPLKAAAALAALSLVVAACSGGASPSTSASQGAGTIKVEGAWARPSMGMERAVAVYMTLTNETGTADALVGAESPAAATVEVHETTADPSGQMAMHPVEKIDLPAGGTVELKTGGYHIMLIDLTGDLMAGDEVEVTLHFDQAPDVVVTAEVREG